MKHHNKYSILDREKIVVFILMVIVLVLIGMVIGNCCKGEEPLVTCWAMCKPGSRVTVRSEPRKSSAERGYLECGDCFQTDGESVDGWIRCYGAGENGWVYVGYVVQEKPETIGERYVCVAKRQVACRKWMSGPQIDERPWMRNGEFCEVFVMADGWAVTSRGYIRSEWLEVSPE